MGISDKCVLVMVCVAFVGAGALYLYVARNLGAALGHCAARGRHPCNQAKGW